MLCKKKAFLERAEYQEKIQSLERIEAQVPKIEMQIQSQEIGLSLLESIINGIEQASRAMQREQHWQQLQKQKKKKHPGLER